MMRHYSAAVICCRSLFLVGSSALNSVFPTQSPIRARGATKSIIATPTIPRWTSSAITALSIDANTTTCRRSDNSRIKPISGPFRQSINASRSFQRAFGVKFARLIKRRNLSRINKRTRYRSIAIGALYWRALRSEPFTSLVYPQNGVSFVKGWNASWVTIWNWARTTREFICILPAWQNFASPPIIRHKICSNPLGTAVEECFCVQFQRFRAPR